MCISEVGYIHSSFLKVSNTALDHWLSAVALKLANLKIMMTQRLNNGISEKNFRLVRTLLVIGAITLFAVFIIHWASLQNFRQNFFFSKKPYFEAKLVNRCLLHERFFAIEVLGQPEKFYFQNSKSKIFVKKGLSVNESTE